MAAAEAVATSADEEVVFEGEKTREERDERSCVARPCRWTSVEADRQCWAWGGLGSLGIFVGTTVYTVSCVARRYGTPIESKMVKLGMEGTSF